MDCHLENIDIHYELFGDGRPLLFLHGGVGDHQFWQHILEPFFEGRSGWKRIYPDLPAHGLTSAPEWLNSNDQVLDIMVQFIDHILPGERFAVGGFSWGAELARGILHHRFSSTEGLLLIAPPMPGLQDGLPPHIVIGRDEAAVAELDESLLEPLDGIGVAQDRDTVSRLKQLFPAMHQSIKPNDASFHTRIQPDYTYMHDILPQPFDHPALFLMGRQDNLVGYRKAWDIIEQYPRASFVVLDRAGHLIASIEQAETTKALILDWLDRIEQDSPR